MWNFVPDHEKRKLDLKSADDGEFWMSFYDFCDMFTYLEMCHLDPNSLTVNGISPDKKCWEISVVEGKWVPGVTAGGSRRFLDTFGINPIYQITLEYPDEYDDECTVIAALMQKNKRTHNQEENKLLIIGFQVYHVKNPEQRKPLDTNFFEHNMPEPGLPAYQNSRQVSHRFNLPPGVYCIVPSTYEPHEEGEFLLRIFSENKIKIELMSGTNSVEFYRPTSKL